MLRDSENLLIFKNRSYYILGFAEHTEVKDLEVVIVHELFGNRNIVAFPTKLLETNDDVELERGNYPSFSTKRAYRHFKGKLYYVKDIVVMAHTGEAFVYYQALYGDHKGYIRPFDMFIEEVPEGREEDNLTKQKYRFETFDGLDLDK